MKVEPLDIPDVKIITPQTFADDRGHFTETYTEKKFASAIGDVRFVQDNQSFSKQAFVLRGLHYQAPPCAQDKLVRVIAGEIYDVAVDVRQGSPTFGKWVGATISAENRKQIFVPKGFLHGFLTLQPETLVAYKVSAFYDKASDGAVMWSSPELEIDWPLGDNRVLLSKKDAAAMPFAEFESPFA